VLRGDPGAGVARDALGSVVTARVPAGTGAAGAARTAVAQVRSPGGHSGKQGAMQVHVGGTPAGTTFALPPGVTARAFPERPSGTGNQPTAPAGNSLDSPPR
jgi:hypothetical protein